MDERRIAKRYEVWFPMRFDTETSGQGVAVSHNISTTGVLMATAGTLDEGATVTVHFQISPRDPSEHRIEGRIIRIEPNAADPHGLWPMRVAVEFQNPLPELESVLMDLEAAHSR